MAEQDQDRNEKATPHKLEEARKKGSVAKSPDFVTLAVMAGGVVFLYALGWSAVRRQLTLDQAILRRAGTFDFEPSATLQWLQYLLVQTFFLMAPLFAIVAIVAILANTAQTGPVFSAHPLSPDFDRLNPATGFKRVFSMRTIYDTLRSLFKLAFLGIAMALTVQHLIPWFLSLLQFDPVSYGRPVIDQLSGVLFKLLLVMLVIAMIDVMYTRWEFAKRMRMSPRDIKDEHKQREGDPRIRSRLRQLRQEMLKKSQAVRKLPGSDVVVTNPTHLAVALSYKHGEMAAPQVVAKGAGDLAAKMREMARRHGIPVVENRVLARALFYQVDFEQPVPEKLYPQVARILVWVFAMRKARAAGASA